MIAPTPLPTGAAREEAGTTGEVWVEVDGRVWFCVKLATVAILIFGLIFSMTWVMWDQNRLIASQQREIERLQKYIRHLEERLGILNQIRSHRRAERGFDLQARSPQGAIGLIRPSRSARVGSGVRRTERSKHA